jgi:hypothetical protein
VKPLPAAAADLADQIERDLLRNQVRGHSGRDSDRHFGSAIDGLTGFLCRLTIHIHKAIQYQTLDARTRKLLQLLHEILVEPFRSLLVKTEA